MSKRKSTAEKIEVMKAADNGQTIECNLKGKWVRCGESEVIWNWEDFDYRILREPRVIWVNMYTENEGNPCYSLSESMSLAKDRWDFVERIMYREVLDDET